MLCVNVSHDAWVTWPCVGATMVREHVVRRPSNGLRRHLVELTLERRGVRVVVARRRSSADVTTAPVEKHRANAPSHTI
jgi:hypothetical protein